MPSRGWFPPKDGKLPAQRNLAPVTTVRSKVHAVTMVTSSYPRHKYDGAGVFVKSLAEQIARDGLAVDVVAPAAGRARADRDGLARVHEFRYSPIRRTRILGYGQAMVADRKLRAASYALIGPYVLSQALTTIVVGRRQRTSVVHAHWLLPNGPAAALAALVLRVPLVISLHGTDVTLAESRPAYSRLAGWLLRRASGIISCSQDLAHRAVRLGAKPRSVEVVPYGVDVGLFESRCVDGMARRAELAVPPEAKLVLGYGRLVAKKGFADLISAFRDVLARHPEAILVIAGDGDLRGDLVSLASDLGIGNRVRFPGLVQWPDVPGLMAAADVFVLPSVHDDTGNVDGLPNTLLEAMAAGRPIVATRVGGVPEAIEHGCTGILVPEHDAPAIASSVSSLLSAGDRARAMGLAAREAARLRFSWPEIARRVEMVYDAALSAEPVE